MGAYPSYHISSGTHVRPVVFKIAIYGEKKNSPQCNGDQRAERKTQ